MKISGQVEVYKIMSSGKKKLVHLEENLLVDGAGEHIVNMLTMPSSIGSLAANAGSATLNPSSWCVRAVSFGKGASSYYADKEQDGVIEAPSRGGHYYSSHISSIYGSSIEAGHPQIMITQSNVPVYGSALAKHHYLPKYPDPMDTSLELSTATMYEVATENWGGTGTTAATSGGLQMGQNLNMMCGASGHLRPSDVFMGCYAPNYGMEYFFVNAAWKNPDGAFTGASSSEIGARIQGDNGGSAKYVGSGHFNSVSSMDNRGFLIGRTRQEMLQSNDHQNVMVVSGACASSLKRVDPAHTLASSIMIKSPAVAHTFTVSAPDAAFTNFYGGIHHLGLWTFDIEKNSGKGVLPPYNIVLDGFGNSNKEYKLFAKKMFVRNLVENSDYESGDPAVDYAGHLNHNDLYIRWKVSFDSNSKLDTGAP